MMTKEDLERWIAELRTPGNPAQSRYRISPATLKDLSAVLGREVVDRPRPITEVIQLAQEAVRKLS